MDLANELGSPPPAPENKDLTGLASVSIVLPILSILFIKAPPISPLRNGSMVRSLIISPAPINLFNIGTYSHSARPASLKVCLNSSVPVKGLPKIISPRSSTCLRSCLGTKDFRGSFSSGTCSLGTVTLGREKEGVSTSGTN